MLKIESIRSPSPASSAGFRLTDTIISCNGHDVNDWVDFLFHAGGTSLLLGYRRGGIDRTTSLRRLPGAEWGFTFRGQEPRRCRRKCVFCFVDQMPRNVRPSLLVKDDDIRYSLLQGTYVTLDVDQVEYAVTKRLSPVHVSVHATDPRIRGRLLGTDRGEPVLPGLRELSEAGIEVETQIVIVPGMNDGACLKDTLADLFSVPGVRSVGVVPVGLTEHRAGLPVLQRPDRDISVGVIETCDEWRARAGTHGKGGWVFPSDEFFLLAGMEIPPSGYYSGCTLRENGIGMLRELMELDVGELRGMGALCTGSLAAPFIERLLKGSEYTVVEVENLFLGRQVGVAGLLSGTDVAGTVSRLPSSYNRVILPSVMFNLDGFTIDGLTHEDISRITGRTVNVLESLEELD